MSLRSSTTSKALTRAARPAFKATTAASPRPCLASTSALKPALAVPRRLRFFSTTPTPARSEDPGGKPNDGSHSTVYDDFYNITGPSDPNAETGLSIESITSTSFTLSDGLVLRTPIAIVNGYCFMWDPPKLDASKALPNGSGWEEWTSEEALQSVWTIFDVVEPKPEVLLFGTGTSVLPPPPAIRKYLNSLGIQLEVQSSQNAASTFNVLAEEGRKVAIACILSAGNSVDRSTASTSSASSIPQQRSFSTSARSNASATSDDFPSPTASATSQKSTSTRTPSGSHLTLRYFLLRSSIYSLYRCYIRATQAIPNSLARYETIQFYRTGFQKALQETELSKAKDLLDYQKRDFKRVSPGWELAGGMAGNGPNKEIVAKFRGPRA